MPYDTEKKVKEYKPTDKEVEKIEFIYDELQFMLDEVMNQQYPEFNDRTLTQFIDDSQRRANAYVPSKESQGKDDWQANVFTKTTRNKVKALLASIAKNPPRISMEAFDAKNRLSVIRGDILSHIVEATYLQGDNNPEYTIYMDGWNCTINGTVVKYDGYIKTTDKVKIITGYDLEKGEVEFEEQEEIIEDKPIEIDVPLQHLLIKNIRIADIQEQPALIWLQYLEEEQFEREFNGYKNFDKVPDKSSTLATEELQIFFYDKWKDRVQNKKCYEVLRYFNKQKEQYCIIANGVLLFDGPMLWGKRKKRYPFAKQVFEPFANAHFFYGNSLPNILMAEQDVENALINSMLDKTYRSVVAPMLVGIVNRDSFDLEDEYVDQDTNIYVEDINQVKPMPVEGIQQGEITMLKIIQQGMDRSATDQVQSGASWSGSTAREIVIANERAEELKDLMFTMMKDLWLQKYRIRTVNVLMNYNKTKVRHIVGEEGEKAFEETYQVFRLPNQEFATGERGIEQIEVVGTTAELARPFDLDVREEQSRLDGQPIAIKQITSDFLDDYEYIVKIETESLKQKSRAFEMAEVEDQMRGTATYFPQIFLANQQEFFKMYMERYGTSPDRFLENMTAPTNPMMALAGGAPGQAQPAGIPGAGGAPALPALSGT